MPTFPVDLSAWLTCDVMEQQYFDLGEGVQVQTRTAGGEVLRMGGAARLWRGRLSLFNLRHEQARAMHAQVHALRAAGASFYVGDRTHKGGTFAAQIASANAAGDVISIAAGPANQPFAAGDYIAFDYSGRRALHQVVTQTGGFYTLSAAGARAGIEIVPPLRPGWTANQAITVGASKCKAVLVPGGSSVGSSNRVATSGVTLDWVQTLRETP